MIDWLRRLFHKQPTQQPLKGKPPVRREKAYTAETGYVYQYFYEGYREVRREGFEGREYLFNVTSDRASRFPVRLFLGRQVIRDWESRRDRELNPTEQYAVVKMSLFQTFDEMPDPGSAAEQVTITVDQIEEHAETLDFL